MPKHKLLCNTVNRFRSKDRPGHINNLDFVLNHAHIPNNFLRHDIRVGNNRHLIFMTEYQITLLKNAATWYMDGTFRVIRKPFTQLYGIHVFVTNGDSVSKLRLLIYS